MQSMLNYLSVAGLHPYKYGDYLSSEFLLDSSELDVLSSQLGELCNLRAAIGFRSLLWIVKNILQTTFFLC